MPPLPRAEKGERAVRYYGAEQDLPRAKCGSMRACLSSEVDGVNARPGLEGGDAEGWVRVRPGLGSGVNRVTGWPVPDFKCSARPNGREAVPMSAGVVPRQGVGVERKEVLAAGVSGCGSIDVEGL